MPARRRVTRYYLSDDGTDPGITPSRLARLGREKQLEYMRAWFATYYEDPVQETPWVDGEYLYIHGGPYSALDELYSEFGKIVPEERIHQAAEEIEGEDGTYDWAPTSRHSDHIASIDDIAAIDDGADLPKPPDLEELIPRLRRGASVNLGTSEELAARERFARRITALQRTLAARRNRPPGKGHNNPPPDDPGEEELQQEAARAIAGIEQTTAEIAEGLQQPTPNVLRIAEKTSRLAEFRKWFGDRINKGVDALIAAGTLYGADQIITHIHDIEIASAHWIHAVISML